MLFYDKVLFNHVLSSLSNNLLLNNCLIILNFFNDQTAIA